MAPTRIGIVGASGETGSSIVQGLLQAGGYSLVALTRPASLEKTANKALAEQGLELRPFDISDSPDALVAALKDIDVLISAVGPFDQLSQINLATAAKKASVKRFFPCAFVPTMPVGVHILRDQKEEVYNHIKRLHLSYTIIDVGWWYQIAFPALPSGKIDYAVAIPGQRIPGDGAMGYAITDVRDVGRYVAACVADERTRDKYVSVYNEVWSKNDIYTLLERLSGETIPREHVSLEALEAQIADANEKLKSNPNDPATILQRVSAEYMMSMGIRGDNTPGYAKFLGYVTSKELWPEMEYVKFEDYLKEVVAGGAKGVYEERAASIKEMLRKNRSQ